MSEEHLIEIIGRAMVESDFRALLIKEPEAAVKDYDLTEEEMVLLRDFKPEVLESLSNELEQRISRTGLSMDMFEDFIEPFSNASKARHDIAMAAVRNKRQ